MGAKPVRCRTVSLRAAAVDNEQLTADSTTPGGDEAALAAAAAATPSRQHLAPISADELSELQLAELDGAQEQLLSWMMNVDEEDQDEELDEMVDYDEFGDEEYEELFEDVEELMTSNEDNSQLKVADKVMGTVYELDDDGAYVEIGQKASGFVPLSECSFAKLKSVGPAGPGIRGREGCRRAHWTSLVRHHAFIYGLLTLKQAHTLLLPPSSLPVAQSTNVDTSASHSLHTCSLCHLPARSPTRCCVLG